MKKYEYNYVCVEDICMDVTVLIGYVHNVCIVCYDITEKMPQIVGEMLKLTK